jgi:hypothetical protein
MNEENEKNLQGQELTEEQRKQREEEGKQVLDAFFERKAEEGQMVAKRGYRVNHQEV